MHCSCLPVGESADFGRPLPEPAAMGHSSDAPHVQLRPLAEWRLQTPAQSRTVVPATAVAAEWIGLDFTPPVTSDNRRHKYADAVVFHDVAGSP
jgi:hypothetical protein